MDKQPIAMQQIAKDFYSVLNIPPGTSKEEIRQAYLRLARRYHPDVNRDPRSRERFEEINQAYTLLSDDEARIFYDLYREGAAEDEPQDTENQGSYGHQAPPQSWWQRNSSTVGVGVAVSCVLAAYGVVLYLPNIQHTQIFPSGVESGVIKQIASVISKQDVKASDSDSSKPEKSENNSKLTTQQPSEAVSQPELSSTANKQPATAEQPEPQKTSVANASSNSGTSEPAKPTVIDQVVPSKVFGTVVPQPTLSLKTAAPSSTSDEVLTTVDTPARAHELLAYYALVVGDLNQFKKALGSAHRENASFGQINSLMLFLQQLETRNTSLENTLQALRRRVIREDATRMTPLQLESLKKQTENWQSSENS
jgi:curved DNA-binding protein CbpA